jgi:hypothetical protein
MNIESDKSALGDGIKWEVNSTFCRDTVTIASGQSAVTEKLTVLGKVTATGKYKILAPAASDGTQTAAAISCSQVDATLVDAIAVVLIRGPAVVDPAKLEWPSGITTNQKTTAVGQLLALGIKAGVGA